MNRDERLDQLIRVSLDWQAEQGIQRAPALAQSARVVVARLGRRSLRVESTVVAGAETSSSVRVILVAALLVALLAAALTIGAQLTRRTELSSSPTGSLAEGRGAGHAALALRDGRVLVAFGWQGFGPVSSIEIWDPASKTFTTAGSLEEARDHATVAELRDGQVLFVGGFGGPYAYQSYALTSAELWDPASGSFSPAGSMATKRASHTATLLGDGRVLIVGDGGGTAEVWNPASRTFGPAGTLSEPHADHAATLLPDGRVLVVGGTSAEIWDPGSGGFTDAGTLVTARTDHAVALLSDGRVLVLGGRPYPTAGETGWLTDDGRSRITGDDGRPPRRLASAELWDPNTMSFSPTGSLTEGRIGHTITVLQDGRAVVLGGEGIVVDEGQGHRTLLASAEVWDPRDGSFSPGPDLYSARSGHTATHLADDRLLIVGGDGPGGPGDALRSAELYHPEGQS